MFSSIYSPPSHLSNLDAGVVVIAPASVLSLRDGGLGAELELELEPPEGPERRHRQISLKNLCQLLSHERKDGGVGV